MKLYYSPGACSLAPHILINETETEAALERVDTATHKTQGGADYYALNSKGQVPVLELQDGSRLTEGPIIAQYIADHSGRRDLMPEPASQERYRVMEWQNYVTSELHKSFTPLFQMQLPDDMKSAFHGVLRKKYEWLDKQLAGKAHLTGDAFTAADAYLFTVTNWAKPVALDLTGLDEVGAFQARVLARPAVQEAMRTEGLIG